MTLNFELVTCFSMCAFLWCGSTKPNILYRKINRITEQLFNSLERVLNIGKIKNKEGTKSLLRRK